jgi:hypothetical protein
MFYVIRQRLMAQWIGLNRVNMMVKMSTNTLDLAGSWPLRIHLQTCPTVPSLFYVTRFPYLFDPRARDTVFLFRDYSY